jgi:hypothetical protein
MLLFTIDFESVNVYGDEWIAYAAVLFDSATQKVVEHMFRAVRRPSMDAPQREFWTRHNDALTYLMRCVNPVASVIDLEIELANFARSLHDRYPAMQLVGDNPAFDYAILNGIMQRTGRLPMTYRNSGYAFIRDVSGAVQVAPEEVAAVMRNNGIHDPALQHTPMFDAVRVLMSASRVRSFQ